jgi:hypothetical protein
MLTLGLSAWPCAWVAACEGAFVVPGLDGAGRWKESCSPGLGGGVSGYGCWSWGFGIVTGFAGE